jgi:hypothetical protein
MGKQKNIISGILVKLFYQKRKRLKYPRILPRQHCLEIIPGNAERPGKVRLGFVRMPDDYGHAFSKS